MNICTIININKLFFYKCESMALKFIYDPRKIVASITVDLSSSTIERRKKLHLFSDDPLETGRKIPALLPMVDYESFQLTTDSNWMLDGHFSAINEKDGLVFTDRILSDTNFNFQQIYSTDRDTSLRCLDGQTITLLSDNKEIKQLPGEIGVACSVEPSNWGAFLSRIVPKAMAFKNAGIKKILVHAHHPNQKDILKWVGYNEKDLIIQNPKMHYGLEVAHFISEPASALFIHQSARNALRSLAEKVPKANFGKLLYVSRSAGVASRSKRQLINEKELEEALQKLGFQVLIPDMFSVSEQIAAFRDADFIVGPSGAGLFNAVFCKPGTQLIDIESSSSAWSYGHANLFSSLDLNYGFVWGKVEDASGEGVHKSYFVDVNAVVERVKSMLG